MLHGDAIVTHMIMDNMHIKQCPYIRGEWLCYARQSQVSAQCPIPLQYLYNTYTIEGQNVIPHLFAWISLTALSRTYLSCYYYHYVKSSSLRAVVGFGNGTKTSWHLDPWYLLAAWTSQSLAMSPFHAIIGYNASQFLWYDMHTAWTSW